MGNTTSSHSVEIVTSDLIKSEQLANAIRPFGVEVTISEVPNPVSQRALLFNYYKIVPPKVISEFGSCNILNLHNGKLPEYRGLHTMSWMIQNGEKFGCLTLHQVSTKVDTGAVVAEFSFPISLEMDANDASSIINSGVINWLPTEIFRWLEEPSRVLRAQSDNLFPPYPRKHDNNFFNSKWKKRDAVNLLRAVNPPYGPGAIFIDGPNQFRVCLPISSASQEFCKNHLTTELPLQLSDSVLLTQEISNRS